MTQSEPFGVLGLTKFYTIRDIPFKNKADKERIEAHIKTIGRDDLKRRNPTAKQWEKAREWMDITREMIYTKLRMPGDKQYRKDFMSHDMLIPDCGCEWLDSLCLALVAKIIERVANEWMHTTSCEEKKSA